MTNSYKIRTIGILLFSLILNLSMYAQDSIKNDIVIDLFEVDKESHLRDKYITSEIDGEILKLNHQKLLKLVNSDVSSFVLRLPLHDEIISLNLNRSSFIVRGAKGKTMHKKFETDLAGRGLHFWGHAEDPNLGNSIITFSFYKDNVYGFFFSQLGNYSLYKLNDEPNSYVLYKYKKESKGFECATDIESISKIEDDMFKFQERNSNTNGSTLDYPIEISMNANNCVINNPFMGNSSITQTIDYILSHFNLYSLIFANEEVSIKISEIVLEDNVPNGTGQQGCIFGVNASTDFFGPGMTPNGNCPSGTTTYFLEQFQDILGNSYVGDYAYMFVGSSCHAEGRAAAIGAFCNNLKTQRMAVGRAANSSLDEHQLPDFYDRLNIFPHEMGHLFGLNHNFCTTTPYYNIMLSGPGDCYDVDPDFRRGFGVYRGNILRNNIENNKSCFNQDVCAQDDLYIFHRIEDLGSVDYSAFYKATNIVADNIILNTSEALYIAETAIELIPGFEVEENSEFEARIEACNNSGSRKSSISNDDVSKIDILISPTTIEDIVNVENKSVDGIEMSSIRIYNLIGTEVFKKDGINDRKVNLNLSHLSKGFYIVKISTKDGSVLHTQKIIKK